MLIGESGDQIFYVSGLPPWENELIFDYLWGQIENGDF